MSAREGFARIGLVLSVLGWLFAVALALGSLAWFGFTAWDFWNKRGETGSIANFLVYGVAPAFVGLWVACLILWILEGFTQDGNK